MTGKEIDVDFILSVLNNGLLNLTPPKDGIYSISFPIQFKNEEPTIIEGRFKFKDDKWLKIETNCKDAAQHFANEMAKQMAWETDPNNPKVQQLEKDLADGKVEFKGIDAQIRESEEE